MEDGLPDGVPLYVGLSPPLVVTDGVLLGDDGLEVTDGLVETDDVLLGE